MTPVEAGRGVAGLEDHIVAIYVATLVINIIDDALWGEIITLCHIVRQRNGA